MHLHQATDHSPFAAMAPRLRRLILLLASPHDGEALGATRAIGRFLDSAGLDFHALADAITPQLPAPEQKASVRPNVPLRQNNWRSAIAWIRASGVVLSDWEMDFLASLPRFDWLSNKQLNCLSRILKRAGGYDG
jgi:hypothetical protein